MLKRSRSRRTSHRDPLKAYCAAAGDTIPAIFGDGRHASPVEWRCVKSAVYTCLAGADGVACSARSRSRIPRPGMVDACRGDGQLSVASGAMGYVWQWDCRDGKAAIAGPQIMLWHTGKTSEKFDAEGYAESEWHALLEGTS